VPLWFFLCRFVPFWFFLCRCGFFCATLVFLVGSSIFFQEEPADPLHGQFDPSTQLGNPGKIAL
jgi:hypothetical protein